MERIIVWQMTNTTLVKKGAATLDDDVIFLDSVFGPVQNDRNTWWIIEGSDRASERGWTTKIGEAGRNFKPLVQEPVQMAFEF